MELDDERVLASQAQAGDRQAFDKLIRMNKDKMYALIYRMTGDRETTLDLMQETFFSAFKELGSFRGGAAFSSWLYRIAANKALNHLRRAKLRSLITFGASGQAEPSYNMPDNLAADEIRKAAARGISLLPPKQRLIFTLRFYQELPFGEVARILGRSESTIKTQYQKAIEKLREHLKDFR